MKNENPPAKYIRKQIGTSPLANKTPMINKIQQGI
jgi:hypothetical protein